MGHDDLTERLADVARQRADAEALSDDTWEALAAGTLSATELAALWERAESDPEIALALEACQPASESFKSGLVDQIVGPEKRESWLARAFRMPALRWTLAPVAAAAAATIIIVSIPGNEPLPPYALEVTGGLRDVRGSEEPTANRFAPGSRLELILRPDSATKGPMAARLFARANGPWQTLHLKTEADPSGAVRVSGVLGRDFQLAAGEWQIAVVIGPPGALPASPDNVSPDLQLVTGTIRIEE